MPTYLVEVENRAGTVQGGGPITTAHGISFGSKLGEADTFRLFVPKRDPKSALLAEKTSIIRIYEDDTEIFAGVVEYTGTVFESDETASIEVRGRDLLAELDESSPGHLDLSAVSAGVSNAPDLIMNGRSGWTITGGNSTTESMYGRIAGEGHLEALGLVRDRTGDTFRLSPTVDREVEWLTSFSSSGVRAVFGRGNAVSIEGNPNICLIESFEIQRDAFDMVNRIFPYGAGQGETRLTLTATSYSSIIGSPQQFFLNKSSNYIDRSYAGYPYSGVTIARHMEFKDIGPVSNTDADVGAAADMLADATMRYLERYGQPAIFYSLDVRKLPAPVQVGTTLLVDVYEEDADGTAAYDINETLNVLAIKTRINADGSKSHRLLVSATDRQPVTDGEMVVGRLQQGKVFQAHPQIGPNVSVIAMAKEFDDTYSFSLPFWLDEAIAQVQQILLRFRVDPLRSTVKSVVGGASTESTTDSETVNLTTTDSGGSSTPVSGSGNHVHPLNIPPGTITDNIGLDAGGGLVNATGSTATPSTQFETGGHSHTVTISAHSHGITMPGHDHGMEHTHPNVNTYGIFEDSGGTVVDDSSVANLMTDMTISINGTSIDVSDVDTTAVSGWYEIDLTDLDVTSYALIDADSKRPVQEANQVIFIGASGKRGRVTAQLYMRNTIQSVAYL